MVGAFADLSADPLLPARAGKGDSMTAWICFAVWCADFRSRSGTELGFARQGGQVEANNLTEHLEPSGPESL